MIMPIEKTPKLYAVPDGIGIVKDIQENYLTGYVKIYRSLREHWIWEDAVKLKWWLDILMECNHENRKVPIGFELFECKRGQTLHSRLEWSKRWRVDESTVRRFLALLEADHMVKLENLKKTTRLTVCNYASYNDARPKKDQPRNLDASQTQYEQELKELEEGYKAIEKTKEGIHRYIKDSKPKFINPYVDYWNLFASTNNLSKVAKITDGRVRKFNIRIKESGFDFLRIIYHASRSIFLLNGKWFSFDWIIEKESNYIKILEGQYDSKEDKPENKQQLSEFELALQRQKSKQ